MGRPTALFGTNPIACAAPRKGGPPVVVDQSSSVVALGEVIVHANKGAPIPEGWAFDRDGEPTTDPDAVLAGGSMAPLGGYKGVGLALVVEIMAAALTGANLSFRASSFVDNEGGPPRTGQFFIAIDPDCFSDPDFGDRFEALIAAMLEQDGTRLPGDRRLLSRERTARDGVTIGKALYERIMGYCD